jgi:hypothetical protein
MIVRALSFCHNATLQDVSWVTHRQATIRMPSKAVSPNRSESYRSHMTIGGVAPGRKTIGIFGLLARGEAHPPKPGFITKTPMFVAKA